MPAAVLGHHLARLGLPVESDGSGRFVLPALAPGAADVFLAGASSEGAIAAGLPEGHLRSIARALLAAEALDVIP